LTAVLRLVQVVFDVREGVQLCRLLGKYQRGGDEEMTKRVAHDAVV